MKLYIPMLACLLMAGPVCAQSVGEKTGVNSVLGVSPSTADFVKEAASSDMFEVQSSQLAAERADDATKTYAKQMIADHQKTTDELQKMINSNAVAATMPTAMSSAQQSMFDKLKGLNGGDFTKLYHSDQVSAHKDAVSLFKRYADGGDHAGMKEWAIKTEPTLEDHLRMAQDLDK